jgi:hypothetical protein
MKYIIVLLLSTLCLASCAKVTYQARDEFTPNGYSELHLKDDTYRISYETYVKKATEKRLTEMAEYRAAELTLEMNKAYFEIISVNFTEAIEGYDVPEQRIKNTYAGGVVEIGDPTFGITKVNLPETTEETIIPAHVRQFKTKRMDIEVKINVDKNNDRAKSAQSIIDERDFR